MERKSSEINNNTLNYNISHIIHNNLIFHFINRPKNSDMPNSLLTSLEDKTYKNSSKEHKDYCSIQSFNISIILNSTAYVESTLEELLIAPSKNKMDVSDRIILESLKILKDEIIKISSLEKYINFYKKIFNKAVRDLVNQEEFMCVQLLFDIRNMVIHCSNMSGIVKKNNNIQYLYVDDPSYLSIVERIRKLFNLDNSYYWLPETLLYWNGLIDKIFVNVLSFIKKISNYSKTVYPDINMPLAYYDSDSFGEIINSN